MCEITDCKIRYSQLFDIISTVKRYADLKLNNDMDYLIDKRIQEDAADNVIWEKESCPDLQHGQDEMMPEDDWNDLNQSFPGLNPNYDMNKKRFELLDWFNQMAAEDAELERLK